jgi:signal transduction histidine kinase
VLEQFGLTAALKKLVKTIDNSTDIFITEEIENIDNLLSKQQELGVYRIAQEAMNNIIKHANSPSALIAAKKDNQFITLCIKDYGKGFDWSEKSTAKNSLGMKTLQERAKILNANLNIDSELEKGTTVYLKIPLKNA